MRVREEGREGMETYKRVYHHEGVPRSTFGCLLVE